MTIGFVDFWNGFMPHDNFIIKALNGNAVISENPDVLFYSCFGTSNRKYNHPLKIFFTGENVRPNVFECDYSISFDFNDDVRNIRWPLYNLYYDAKEIIPFSEKSKFACMVVSNPSNLLRLEFFQRLSRYSRVDSGGACLNNIGGRVPDKTEFIKNYKFCIAFENMSFPGYTTEKILEAKRAGCIPIYWGNELINRDFDPAAFINLSSFKSIENCIEYIEYVNNNDNEFLKIQSQPLLKNTEYTKYSSPDVFSAWLLEIMKNGKKRPRKKIKAGLLRTQLAKYTVKYNEKKISLYL